MMEYGPPERVYVENDWYDGPQAGIADINGVPHRFKSIFDESEDEYRGAFMIWPIDKEMLALEIEGWGIFVEWNALYESGQADTKSHPGLGGRNSRYDEIEVLLKQDRSEVPAGSKRAVFQYISIDRKERYALSGPDYMLSWSFL
jgi:hypothetical protein